MISTNTEMTRPPDPGHPESHESVSTRCDGDDPHPYMDGSSASWRQSCMTGTTYARTQHAVYCHTHIQAIQTTRWTVMCRMVSWDGPRSRDPEIPRSRDPEITRSRDPEMTRSIRWMVGSTGVRTTHTAEMPEQGRASMCVKETAIAVYVQPHEQAHQDPRPRDPEITRSGDAIPEITRSGDDESGVWIHRPREHRPHQWWV